jgi:hypothetical protein
MERWAEELGPVEAVALLSNLLEQGMQQRKTDEILMVIARERPMWSRRKPDSTFVAVHSTRGSIQLIAELFVVQPYFWQPRAFMPFSGV